MKVSSLWREAFSSGGGDAAVPARDVFCYRDVTTETKYCVILCVSTSALAPVVPSSADVSESDRHR